MRALLQRVSFASVTVNGRIIGQIDRGFVILLGVTHSDTSTEADWLANKIAGLRLFEDEAGKMNLGLADVGGSVLWCLNLRCMGMHGKGNGRLSPLLPAQNRPNH